MFFLGEFQIYGNIISMEEIFEKLLNEILEINASDVHFEIKDHVLTALARTPYKMKLITETNYCLELVEYLKYQSNIDLSNPGTPQSGSFRYYFKGFEYYFRVAYIKTIYTETVVLRILNKLHVNKELSLFNSQNKIFNQIIQKQNGLILLSGPTGSGKTTTLYNLLCKAKEKKIYTIEDPIEIYFDFLVQIQVNLQRGLGYDAGLKQILRHDPDIIVIGEIRDELEAKMAIRCSLTGHLVIASIHSKSSISTIQRMLDFGVNKFDLYETLVLISNQRLVTIGKSQERIAIYELMEQIDVEAFSTNTFNKERIKTVEQQIHLLSQSFQKKNI